MRKIPAVKLLTLISHPLSMDRSALYEAGGVWPCLWMVTRANSFQMHPNSFCAYLVSQAETVFTYLNVTFGLDSNQKRESKSRRLFSGIASFERENGVSNTTFILYHAIFSSFCTAGWETQSPTFCPGIH